MPSHIHLLVQTLEPNLARGLQHWLSKTNVLVCRRVAGMFHPSLEVSSFCRFEVWS